MRRTAAGFIVCAVLAGAAIAFGGEALGSAGLGAQPNATPSPTVSGALQSAFSSLSSTGPVAAPPAGLQADLSAGTVATYGLNFQAAIAVPLAGLDVSVVPGASGACVIVSKYITSGPIAGATVNASNCDSTSDVLSQGLVVSVYHSSPTAGSTATLVALVPNGNTSVSVSGEAQEQVPVVGNLAVASAPVASTSPGSITLSFRNADGNLVSSTQRSSDS